MSIARPLRTALVAAVAWGAIAGCSDGGTVDEAATTTTRPEPTLDPTTTAPPTDEEAILAAVDGYWRTLLDSSSPPDPEHPDLAIFLTGEALATSVGTVRDRQVRGLAVRLPENAQYQHHSQISTVADGEAVVEDCGIDDAILYEIGSGDVLNDAVSTTLREMRLVMVDGAWKVESSTPVTKWEGVDGCAG